MQTISIDDLYALYRQHPHICTDTRQIVAGSIFCALKGANFDGNRFAHQALQQGAAYALVDDPHLPQHERCCYVSDVLNTLQQLAQHHRQQHHIPVIAIAGSNGKTTTKELCTAVLRTTYHTHATAGNQNNHIGVPLTLLSMPTDCQILVVEIGANHPNELADLCRIAQPTHGLVTNIGKEHLEGFGSIEGVQQAEGELYDYLALHNGIAWVYTDDPLVPPIAQAVLHQISYGTALHNHVAGQIVSAQPYLHIALTQPPLQLHTQIVGQYNLPNVLAAVAIGQHLGVHNHHIAQAITAYVPANKRSQLIQRGNHTLIMDAYNANPTSMSAAISSLLATDAPQKVAILGDMLEMGTHSLAEHRAIVAQLRAAPQLDQVVLVGSEFAQADPQQHFLHCANAAQAQQWYRQQTFANGALLLLKASRGIALERLLAD